ncbi:hypothetical protein BS17DRAFT_784400 [Gyrodon lividus]|nr:hypothetical protein BS17DRAFT_784400 [Gyrodon lividus]
MNARHGLHRRFLGRRQGLGGAVGDLFGGGNSPTPSSVSHSHATLQNPGDPLGLGGIVGGLTGVPTVLPPSESSSATPSSAPLTHSYSSSTGSTTTTTTTTTGTTSSTPATSTSISISPNPITPTPTSTPTPIPSHTVYSTTSGDNIVYIASTLPAPSATVASPKPFLQNPSLEGGVFTLVGIAALIIIFVLVTWTIRKRRHNRLDRDAAAVTFDPAMTDRYDDARENTIEKHRLSGSSSGHGHGFGYGAQSAYAPALAPPQGYCGQTGHGQYPAAACRTPPPNPAPYHAPSPAAHGHNTNGANLTRKYSDRKPVPPLLPNPVYDPSHTQISLPQQYYQEQPLPPASHVPGGTTE